MKKLIIYSFLLLCSITYVLGNIQIYSLQDLQVLSSEKNYSEFFNHALDIKPAQRGKNWKDMVESMGQNYLSEILNLTEIDSEMFTTVKRLSNWPIFKNNEFFIKKRDKVFLREISSCAISNSSDCLSLSSKIYNDFNHEEVFSFHYAKSVSKLGTSNSDLWPYVKNFVKKDISEFYCNKAPLNNIVKEQIFLHTSSNPKFLNHFHADCLKSLAKEFKEDLVSKDFTISHSAYMALKVSKQLNTKDIQLYNLIHFINSDILDENLLNSSLSTIKALSKDYKARESLIKSYIKIDPLPDNIFSLDKKSNISRAKILSRYFPEIIDKYANTCLSYLKGDGQFPNGNPTPNCHSFFDLSKKYHLVPESFLKQYDKATYFLKKKPL